MDLSPLWISLKISGLATVITFVIGVVLAGVVSKMRRGKTIIDSLISIPLVLPPTVVGFLLLVALGSESILGKLLEKMGTSIVFNTSGAVIAATIVSLPIMYRTARGAMEQIDGNLINVARTLGMGEAKIFFRVIVPNAWPGIAAATVLAFARALGEFGATIMVAGNIPGKTQTMSVAVYTFMQGSNREMAYRWVGIIIIFSVVMLGLMNYVTDHFKRRGV